MMKLNNKSQNTNYNTKSVKGKPERISENYEVFGKDLRALVEGKQLPELISMLGYIIRHQGLQTQGIFRISGNKTRMDELRVTYGLSRRLEVGTDDIHNVTGLFKSFLREIPGGVIPCPQSLDLIKATRLYKRTENLDLLTTELLKLPVPHYNLLKFTCSLLQQVSQYSSSNLMTSDNLGTIFGPTFFSSVEDVTLLTLTNTASAALIHYYSDLFKVSAPVHTNLNQTIDNGQRSDDTNGDFSNGYMTQDSGDNIVNIRFGDSSLIFTSNGENPMFSNSLHNEDSQLFPELLDSFNVSHTLPGHSHFSSSLDMAIRMCLTNHLFTQFQDQDFSTTDRICTPRLISDVMLNPLIPQIRDDSYQMKRSPYNVRKKHVDKTKSMDDPTLVSLPRREISSNILPNYFSDSKVSETIIKSDSSQTSSDMFMVNEINYEKPSPPVPQLDFSTLNEASGNQNTFPNSKTKQISKYNSTTTYTDSNDDNVEDKLTNVESHLSEIKRNISNLKRQLRQFEDHYYSMNGVKPDKLVKSKNEWYSKTINELRCLRQEKEQFFNDTEKTEESEPGKNIKKKPVGASGDVTDAKVSSATPSESRSVLSRPMSALSEIRITPSNESCRSNTLNSMTPASNQVVDLSQEELDHLKSALEKISSHLKAERIKDNRPHDLESMTLLQIETEKVSMQKALLNFESTYGRKKTPNAIYLMRPLYDRYRQVKKKLSQLNETRDFEIKFLQRTLDSQSKNDTCKSAWTSDRPLSSGFQSLHRSNMVQSNNRPVYMPVTSEFELNEEFVSPAPQRSDLSNDNKSSSNGQSQKKNVRTIQYRRTSVPNTIDSSNTKKASLQKDDWKAELHQLQLEKKELQRILKDFENNFERNAKRKVEKLDRLPMEREYSRYKYIKNRIKELEELVESSFS